jgi:transposase
MPSDPSPAQPSREELLALIELLRGQVAVLTQQVETLQAEVEQLRAENERLRRQGLRQATPFSKGKRVKDPKKPGRKPGQGPFRSRPAPPLDQVTAWVEVPVTEPVCPYCGGTLAPDGVEVVTETDLPDEPRPKVTAYEVGRHRCRGCGKRVRGQHPDVPVDQRGATAHRVSERVMAAAHALHYGLGVPQRRVPAILQWLCGVPVTQGTLARDATRWAAQPEGAVARAYAALRAQVRQAPAVYTDDSSWKVGGEGAQLMTFDTDAATVYQIRRQHRNAEVRELIPSDYAGTMGCDRGRSYDAKELRAVKQQKCLSHIQRSLSEALESKKGEARLFASQLKGLLSESLALWHAYHAGKAEDFIRERERLQAAVTAHLADRPLRDRDNQRLLNELGRHQDAGNLLRFLADPSVEPTNNRAERALRPAVIARKVSHCSKNERGARAFEAFTSVIQTLKKRGGHSLVKGLGGVFRSGVVEPEPP